MNSTRQAVVRADEATPRRVLRDADVPTKKKAPPKRSQNLPATSPQKLITFKNLTPGAGMRPDQFGWGAGGKVGADV
jgi:hypothetical protein